ncbi:titin homolog isoform X38 [Ostrea edulis]|uniref:titin homolog isoform X38 n=1 Tax=Ostrea edulis TaxID=37623 RepID=UPI0024AF00B7|nr:titin homolog isoform X38 [Ostrea edulis]
MMVGGSSALNLSLLSRGVGEITKNGHEKIDVVFEPQDYYNFVNDSRRIYLPPIQPSYAYDEPSFSLSRASKKSVQEISMPKTFTTRKGALLLFSEDMAQRKRHTHHHVRKSHLGFDDRESQLSKSADEIDLRTVDDLAKSILSFGAQDPDREEGVYLKFVHGRRKRDYFDRQIRPGFSAKRYLSSWTKCWDDNVLEKVISKGYLTEKSLFYYNPLMPHLQRRLNDDMSHYPTPYKLMRSMLMSPGSLSGYTFYRIRPESAETIMTQDVDIHGVPPSQGASIKVISTKDGVQREVTYGSLDKKAQEEVLTDLLVKSAVHYAMKKQQEYLEDNLIRAIETNKIHELSEGQETPTSMPQFNMQEAVESLLDTQRSKGAVIEADLPEDRSSEKSGSLKPKQPIKRHGKDRARSTSSSPAPEEKEYIGGVPVVSFRDGSGSPSSVPQLPHIPGTAPLTPIGEMSREQTTVVPLPPIGKADTDEDWTAQVSQSRVADHTSTKGDVETESKKDKGEVSSHVKGSTESSGTGVHSIRESKPNRTHWKGSQTSVRSSKKGSGSIDDGSVKGSVIMGPEGEIINVGGTIKPHLRDIDMVQDANKVFGKDLASDDSEADDQPDEWKKHRTLPPGARDQMKNFANKRVTSSNLSMTEPLRPPPHGDPSNSANSKVSEKEIMDALADHAQQIAQNVLSRSVSGKDLEEDVRRAARLWMDTHPPRDISRSQSVQDKSIVQEIIAGQEKRKSAGPTAGEYRELIKANLKTAVSSTSGENVPVDTEVSPELLDTLAKEDIAPEDLEIVQDDDGKSLIRSKSQVSMAMGGVKEGHIYVPVAKNGQKGPATSIPVDRQSNADIGELAVIHYSGEKDLVKESSEKTPSDRGSKTKSHPPSTLGESIAEEDQIPDDASEPKSHVSFKDEVEIEDEFQKAIQGLEQKSDKQSVKSAKTESDGKKSKVSVDKSTTPIKKKEEFIVGKVDTKDDIKALYGQPDPPPKEPSPPTMGRVDYKDELKHLYNNQARKPEKSKGKGKSKKVPSPTKKPAAPKEVKPKAKGKGKGKKKEESPEPKPAEPEPVAPVEPPKEPTPPPPTPPPPKEEPPSDPETDRESMSDLKSEESFEFHIVRDSPSPSPPPTKAPSIPSVEEEPETEDEEPPEDEDKGVKKQIVKKTKDEAARLRMISNREARAAKRAAQAEKRRQEVEKRRREREDQLKREKEEFERQQQLKAELEEERRRQEEQRRLRRELADAERDDEERREEERLRRQKLEEEKERRRKEEYQRKLEEMRKRQAEEEKRRHEEMLKKQEEEEEAKRLEAEKMAAMEEEERRQYEIQKKLEEEERLRKEEEERLRREEEARKAMEEARRLAEEMARKQAEMEARLKFNRTLQVEAHGLEHSQDITRAFVFSYFELLQWLGLDIPEFELLKLNQY